MRKYIFTTQLVLLCLLLTVTSLVSTGCSDGGGSRRSDEDPDPAPGPDLDSDADGDVDADSDSDTDSDSDNDTDADTDGDADADTDSDTDADTDSDADLSGPLVKGLDITDVILYQSVEVPLMEGGVEVSPRPVEVVAYKEGLLRIFVDRQSQWTNRKVRAVIELDSAGAAVETLSVEKNITVNSDNTALSSTLNVTIPADLMTPNLKYRVSLIEVNNNGGGGGNADAARWPVSGLASMRAQNMGGPLKIVIIPVRYNADGSGRLPDTSDTQLQLFLDAFYVLYPAAEIEITVEDPLNWNNNIAAMGTGWSQLLNKIQQLRSTYGADKKDYYYGLFKPANSMMSYCGMGCVAGLSNVAQAANAAWARASIGLGFTGIDSASTMVHEVGHAHGRLHAPCGVSDADNNYPHNNAALGTWGYHLKTQALKNPNTNKDFMSYCSPIWISDYTYKALFNRVKKVNALPLIQNPPDFQSTWYSLSVDFEGLVRLGPEVQVDMIPDGEERVLEWLDESGTVVDVVTGYHYPYSHLGGGLVLFPEPPTDVFSVRLQNYQPVELWTGPFLGL